MRSLVLTLMISFLSHKDPEVREHTAGALWNLAANADNRVTIADAEAIPLLVALLEDSEVKVRINAAGALWHLAVNVDNRVTIAGEDNAITNLVALLEDPEVKVRINAAGALWHLAVNVDNLVRIKSEVSTHDQDLIISNLSYLAAENGWVQGLLNLINS